MKKNKIILTILLAASLIYSCQDSPAHIDTIDENSITAEQSSSFSKSKVLFADPESDCINSLDEDDGCCDTVLDVSLDCEDSGGGVGTGGGDGDDSDSGIRSGFHYVHRGGNARLYHAFSSNGTTWSNDMSNYKDITSLSATGGKTQRGPALSYFNNELYAFFTGETSDKIYYLTTADEATWKGDNISYTAYVPVTGRPFEAIPKASMSPVSIVHKNKLFLYSVSKPWIGTYGESTINIFSSSNGSTWASPDTIPGVRVDTKGGSPFHNWRTSALGVATSSSRVYIMYPDANRNTKLAFSADGRTNWGEISIPFGNGKEGYSGTYLQGTLYFVAVGRDSENIYLFKINPRDIGIAQVPVLLSSQKIIADDVYLSTDQTPTIASANGLLVVSYKEKNRDNIRYSYSSDGGTTWSKDENAVGGTKKGGPYMIYVKN